ncbi:protein Rf1, mitochondrial-like isoform X1 [Iris pallida]|uniref:Protein Rf1, mitochondrial-like isoform X1 n=1 Tax=Iris pallida TaxID=29817 RepID=A0AAX6GH56_IRIPA|nr:protein Rf1, mitochondrial-like isoform X1 [Iris pallida]
MVSKGIQPNAVTYNSIIRGHLVLCRWKEVGEIFKEMVDRGRKPDDVTFNTHRKDGKLIDERAEQTYVEYLRLRQRTTASAPTTGEAGTSSKPSSAPSEDELWMTAAGGLQRGTYYGMRSYGAIVATQSSRASAASVHSPTTLAGVCPSSGDR